MPTVAASTEYIRNMVKSEAYKFLGLLQLEGIPLLDGHQQGDGNKLVWGALVDIQFRDGEVDQD